MCVPFDGLLFYSLALILWCLYILHCIPLWCLDTLHCIPRAVGVPVESALNPVSFTGPCGARTTHFEVP